MSFNVNTRTAVAVATVSDGGNGFLAYSSLSEMDATVFPGFNVYKMNVCVRAWVGPCTRVCVELIHRSRFRLRRRVDDGLVNVRRESCTHNGGRVRFKSRATFVGA